MELSCEIHGNIPVISIASADGANRLDTSGVHRLSQMLSGLEEEGHGCAVLTGKGDNFCLGGDLDRLTAMGYREIEAFGRRFTDTLLSMARCGLVIIAAVNGSVQGGGVSLVDACDLAVASESAAFSIPEARGGVPPVISYAGAYRALGRKRANERALLASPISAGEAQRLGLVNRVVPGEEVLSAALELAEGALRAGRFCIREIKTLAMRMDCGALVSQLGAAADRLSGIMLSHATEVGVL